MIGWHLSDVNPYLQRYIHELVPAPFSKAGGMGPRVLVPLCGKTVDMSFLARQGCRVVGVEGVAKGIQEFAAEQGVRGRSVPVALPPSIDPERFRAHAIVVAGGAGEGDAARTPPPVLVIEGDFLSLGPDDAAALVPVPAAFDRGALVAVRPAERARYAQVLSDLVAPGGRALLVTVEHDAFADGKLGPPFEVSEADVRALYGEQFDVELLVREDVLEQNPAMRDRGCGYFRECAYLLRKPAAKL